MSFEQIQAEAMKLTSAEKEQLAELLLRSISPEEQDAIDQAWIEESSRRLKEYDAGSMSADTVENVIQRITSRTHA